MEEFDLDGRVKMIGGRSLGRRSFDGEIEL